MMLKSLFADRAVPLEDSSLKEVLESYPGVISFAGGLPDEHAFDMARIRAVAEEITGDRASWQYIPTEGLPALREAVADHMNDMGVSTSPHNVLITQGSQQGLDLVAKLFINPSDAVLVESPGYIGGLQAIEGYQGRLVPIKLEEDGLCIDELRSAPTAKLLYTVSTFQNPTGSCLSEAKRRAVLDLAIQRGFIIVEDGAYQNLRFEGDPIAPIKQLDDDGHVIYLGSFSKTLVPGVRVGWVVAHESVIDKMALMKQATDLASNTFGQCFVLRWLEKYGVDPPIDLYKSKRDQALVALEREMPAGVSWNRPQGGFFLWLTLPESIDAKKMLPLAKEQGVTYVPGYAFGGSAHSLRFSFSQVQKEDIDLGVQRLATTIRALI